MVQQTNPIQTLVIDNFTGALTRTINGSLNSGLAKFDSSWGYNPFTKPGNLTWNLQIANGGALLGNDVMALGGVTRFESGNQFLYLITSASHLVKIQITTNVIVTDLATLSTGSPTFNYGTSMFIFNNKIWFTNDKGLSNINFDGSSETQVGTWDSSHFIQNTYHPLASFQGKLMVGNTTDGTTTNFGIIDSTNTITTYAGVNPAFPVGIFIRDMDITSDFSYLVFSASSLPQQLILGAADDFSNAATTDSFIFRWNGSDQGITSGISIPNFNITSLNNFGNSEYSFMYNLFGASLYEGGKEVVTLTNTKSPFPNAATASGNFVVWNTTEVAINPVTALRTGVGSMFFYGQLDEGSPVGLWRIFRMFSQLGSGEVALLPFAKFVTNEYSVVNSDASISQIYAQLYFSSSEFSSVSSRKVLNVFTLVTGAPDETGLEPMLGAYETQTQLWNKKIQISQIRVYCEPTLTDNGFQIELIGSDGAEIGNAVFDYNYVAGTDVTKAQGSLDRINFDVDTLPTYAVGVKVTNIGATNMTIKKIELDWNYAGK